MCAKAVVGGRLVDGTGAELLEDSVVLIDGKIVKAVGKKGDVVVPAGAELIDASGKIVMPGLIDAHTHPVNAPSVDNLMPPFPDSYPFALSSSPVMALFGAAQMLRNYLEFGITTIRILHPAEPTAPELRGEWLVALRTAVELGLIPGPRVLAAGVVLPSGGHLQACVPQRLTPPGWWGADGVAEVRKQTRLCVYENVDLIKVLGPAGGEVGISRWSADGPKKQGYTLDEMKAIVEEARFKGIPVSAHAEGGPGLDIAAEALGKGDSIEHCTYLFEHDEATGLMAKKGIFMVPTWAKRLALIEQETDPGKKAEMVQLFNENHVTSLHKARNAGVRIAAGTDSSPFNWPHRSMAVELHGYVKYGGIPVLESIKWATKNAAECLALANVGTIDKGKIADLIVVDGDLLSDISLLRDKNRIHTVIKEGRVVARNGSLVWSVS